jgi:hypothetical protein
VKHISFSVQFLVRLVISEKIDEVQSEFRVTFCLHFPKLYSLDVRNFVGIRSVVLKKKHGNGERYISIMHSFMHFVQTTYNMLRSVQALGGVLSASGDAGLIPENKPELWGAWL